MRNLDRHEAPGYHDNEVIEDQLEVHVEIGSCLVVHIL